METSDIEQSLHKMDLVMNHIKTVQRLTYKLGIHLIKKGDIEFGKILISNGQIHDNSKLKGIEFDHLFYGDPLLPEVIRHHQAINPHHPEYWGSIHKMPEVYVAEMVCDWLARSQEFGTNIREWIDTNALTKFCFTKEDIVYCNIQKYLDILLNPKF